MSKQKFNQEQGAASPDNGGQVESPRAQGNAADPAQAERQLDIEADVDTLRGELERLQADVKEHKERYLRAMAEVENIRRRAQNEVANARKYAVDSFAAEALSVRDSLELARAIEIGEGDLTIVQKMKEGLDLTLKQLDAVFAKFGIAVIEPERGEKLDPERHQAMSMQESEEIEPNHILTVIQKGYSIHERLLRPAMVIVATAATEKQPESEAENT